MTKRKTVKTIVNTLMTKPSYLRWSTSRLVNKFYPSHVDRYLDPTCWDKVNKAKIEARKLTVIIYGKY